MQFLHRRLHLTESLVKGPAGVASVSGNGGHNSTNMSRRLSGVQREVLSLHRSLLRMARSKETEARRNIELFVNAEFRKNAAEVDRRDIQTIEYLLRRGRKQLQLLQEKHVSGFSVQGLPQ